MVIRPLAATDFDAVHTAFNAAFSDYLVPLQLSREQLEEMMTRRGWVPEASAGAFDDGNLVAFTLNGIEDSRAYDTGTGVIPTHRRHGLARDLMRASYPLLRERGCTEYVLEVLEGNEGARALYLSEGFVVARGLQCWRLESPSLPVSRSPSENLNVIAGRLGDRETGRPGWWEVVPSWQNSPASIARAKDTYVTLGNEDGYVIVFPNTGDIPQLAVRPEARRHGIGTRLLNAAAAARAEAAAHHERR